MMSSANDAPKKINIHNECDGKETIAGRRKKKRHHFHSQCNLAQNIRLFLTPDTFVTSIQTVLHRLEQEINVYNLLSWKFLCGWSSAARHIGSLEHHI